jgi:uncharacterized membrane-anchored protein
MKSARWFLPLCLLFCLAAPPSAVSPATAQSRDPDTDTTPVRGPAEVSLGNDVLLALPKGYVFLPKLATVRLMAQMGNLVTPNLLGMVVDGSADWMIMLDYSAGGHVPDTEALDAQALLKRMRAQALREQKETRNVAELYPSRWIEAPRYDKASHILSWSIELQTREKGKVVRTSINTNAAKLGRRGYVILGLVTEPQDLARFRTHLTDLASYLRFRPGQNYADFDKGRDKLAGHSLTGLIAE